jgi:uncharacterized phiE125 gp8 family phage protein
VWTLSVVTPPAAEPLDLAVDVKPHCRVDAGDGDQDVLLTASIKAARQNCERVSWRALISTVFELWMDTWYEQGIYRCERGVESLWLPRAPASAVTSVKYTDVDGVEQTFPSSSYITELPAGPEAQRGRIALLPDCSWPCHRAQPSAIRIRFTAGYGASGAAVPELLKNAMLLEVGEMYERREIAIVGTIVQSASRTAEAIYKSMRAW